MDIDIPGQTLKLEEFDIKTLIKDTDGSYIHPRIVMIAPSGSGKSWIVKNILYEASDMIIKNKLSNITKNIIKDVDPTITT